MALTGAADRILDVLVVPGYSRLGVDARRHWWPADPPRFPHPVDVVVTGASSGLGAATARALAALGARVHLVGRSAQRLESAADRIRSAVPGADLMVRETDVSDLGSVRGLAQMLNQDLHSLHALVHCAGVMPAERTLTDEGNELAFATHVLGPFLLTANVRRLLAADGDGRVVFVSSGGMYSAALSDDFDSERGDYKGVRAYARTKRMQVTLTEQLALTFDLADDPVVHSMHPGWAETPGVSGSLPGFEKVTRPILRAPEQGADTIVWLVAAGEPARSSGRFWHDRRVRPTHYFPWQHDEKNLRVRLWRECGRRTAVALSPDRAGTAGRSGEPEG
jgi:NAD(P)-dependent dehydrogenase (short-subunit alcohol dehydrogenase family)